MGWRTEVTLTCDRCAQELFEEFDKTGEENKSAEDVIDSEGWSWDSSSVTDLICGECADKEES